MSAKNQSNKENVKEGSKTCKGKKGEREGFETVESKMMNLNQFCLEQKNIPPGAINHYKLIEQIFRNGWQHNLQFAKATDDNAEHQSKQKMILDLLLNRWAPKT